MKMRANDTMSFLITSIILDRSTSPLKDFENSRMISEDRDIIPVRCAELWVALESCGFLSEGITMMVAEYINITSVELITLIL